MVSTRLASYSYVQIAHIQNVWVELPCAHVYRLLFFLCAESYWRSIFSKEGRPMRLLLQMYPICHRRLYYIYIYASSVTPRAYIKIHFNPFWSLLRCTSSVCIHSSIFIMISRRRSVGAGDSLYQIDRNVYYIAQRWNASRCNLCWYRISIASKLYSSDQDLQQDMLG